VPKPYPSEFRDDVVRVARDPGLGVTVEQIANDFGMHPMTLQKWLRRADSEHGSKPGPTRSDVVELRGARKRIKLLEQENEVLRRAAARPGHPQRHRSPHPLQDRSPITWPAK
jgi:transposase